MTSAIFIRNFDHQMSVWWSKNRRYEANRNRKANRKIKIHKERDKSFCRTKKKLQKRFREFWESTELIQWLSPIVRWGVSWSTPKTKSGLWKKLIVSTEFRAKVVTNLMSEKLVGVWDYEWKNIVKKPKNPSLDLTQDLWSLWQHRRFTRVRLRIMLWRIITWWIGTTSGFWIGKRIALGDGSRRLFG